MKTWKKIIEKCKTIINKWNEQTGKWQFHIGKLQLSIVKWHVIPVAVAVLCLVLCIVLIAGGNTQPDVGAGQCDHVPSDWIIDAEASCTAEGSKHRECTLCKAVLVNEKIAMLEHTVGEWIVDKEPTCTEEGTHHGTCTVCNSVVTGYIPQIPHTPGEDDGDCTTPILCTVCDGVAISGYQSHNFTDRYDTTCNNPGCNGTQTLGVDQKLGDIYVDAAAPEGGNGSWETPYNTIEQAVAAVRKINKNMKSDIVVYIFDGEYYLGTAIQLTQKDSGTNGHKVIYRAETVGGVRMYGAEKLTGWTEASEVGEGVWKVTVDHAFYTLYENDSRATNARFPNREYEEEFITYAGPYLVTNDFDETNTKTIRYNPEDLEDVDGNKLVTFSNYKDANIVIFPVNKLAWSKMTFNILNVDTESGIITPNYTEDTYGNGCRFYIEGMLELLDVAGEYHYDSESKTLYYMPLNGGNPNEDVTVYAPTTMSIFTLTDASNICFEGLSFEKTDFIDSIRIWYNHDETRIGAVTMWNTSNVTISQCRFLNTGMMGVYMGTKGVNYSKNNLVDSCAFENIGISGIVFESLRGGDHSELMTHNTISNCLIHDLGEMAVEGAGITVWSTQYTLIENCEVYNSPRNGISIRGGAKNYEPSGSNNELLSGNCENNTVKNCLIYNCNQDSADTGALHQAGISFPGEDGNVNYFENIFIDHITAHPSMKGLKPNGYFGDYYANHQSFKNIKITNASGQWNIYGAEGFFDFTSFRYNETNAALGSYDNVSWTLGFEESGMDWANLGLKESFPEALAPGRARIEKALVMRVFSDTILNHGVRDKMSAQVITQKGTIWAPAAYLTESLGGVIAEGTDSVTITLNGSTQTFTATSVDDTLMIDVNSFAKFGYSVVSQKGLIIISEEGGLFDTTRDSLTLSDLSNDLLLNYHLSKFKYEILESAYTDYVFTGSELQEGEYYMLRSVASENATFYAVGMKDGKLRLLSRDGGYGMITVKELDITGVITFTKAEEYLTICVGGTEVCKVLNPFNAVYAGTFTENGSNTLVKKDNGLHISGVPSDLAIYFDVSEVVLGQKAWYSIMVVDTMGNVYDFTQEDVNITIADEAIAEPHDFYIMPKAVGKTTMTFKVTVHGYDEYTLEEYTVDLSQQVEIDVLAESKYVLRDDFDGVAVNGAWAQQNKETADVVEITEDGWLRVFNDNSGLSGKTIEMHRSFTPFQGVLTVEFDFKAAVLADDPDKKTDVGAGILYAPLKDKEGYGSGYALSIFALADKGICVYDQENGSFVKLMDFEVGKEYHFKVEANSVTHTYDVWVDDVLIGDDVAFRFDEDIFYEMMFTTAPNSDCLWNNLKVTGVVMEGEKEPDMTIDTSTINKQAFAENFDSMKELFGDWSADLKYLGTNGSVGIVNGALKIDPNNDGNGNVVVMRSVPNIQGKMLVSFDVTATLDEKPVTFMILGTNKAGETVILASVSADMSGFKYVTPDKKTIALGIPCTTGFTNTVQVVLDTNTQTYDVYIGGISIRTGLPFRNEVSAVTQIRFIGSGKTVGVWDNLVVKAENVEVKPDLTIDTGSIKQQVFVEGFDTTLSGDWKKDAAALGSNGVLGTSNGVLIINPQNDGTKNVKVMRDFADIKGKLSLSVDMTATFDEKPVTLMILGVDGTGTPVVIASVTADLSGFKYVTPTKQTIPLGFSCTNDTKYHVQVVLDTTTNTYDVYINDTQIQNGLAFRNKAVAVNQIQLIGTGKTVASWDNVTLMAETVEVQPDPTPDTTINTDSISQQVFADNFDSALSSKWIKEVAALGSNGVLGTSNGVLIINPQNDGTQNVKVTRNYPEITGKVSVSCDITATFGEKPVTLMILGCNSEGNPVVIASVSADTSGFKYVTPSKQTLALGATCASDVQYHVQVVLDTSTQTFDVYIDSTLIKSGLAFRNEAATVNQLQLIGTGNTVAKWDNVVVMAESGSFTPEEEVIPDAEHGYYDLPEGWTTTFLGTQTAPYAKIVNNQLKVQADGSWVQVSKAFEAVTTELTVEFEFSGSVTNGKAANLLYLRSASGSNFINLLTLKAYGNGALKYQSADGNDVEFGTWTKDTTYKIKVVADIVAKTYTLYVNDTVAVENVTFRDSNNPAAGKIDSIMFMPGNTDTVYYDNVKVTSGETVLIEETFTNPTAGD